MPAPRIRIATRKSPLALWQAEMVGEKLKALHSGLRIELAPLSTRGDKLLDSPLAKIGGKGLFVKELEQSLLNLDADIAVHSMKDVPIRFPAGLHLPVVMEREDPRDAFVSNRYPSLAALPPGARVGTSSLRRQTQIRAAWPELSVGNLRGNVNTRLTRLDGGDFDAIILAMAGLKRLGLERRITACLDVAQSLPAIGQGAIGIECRTDDTRIHEIIMALDHPKTHTCVRAERAMNARLNGSCQTPIAGYAQLEGGSLWLRGLVGCPSGRRIIRAELRGPADQAEMLGTQLAEELLTKGAGEILSEINPSAASH